MQCGATTVLCLHRQPPPPPWRVAQAHGAWLLGMLSYKDVCMVYCIRGCDSRKAPLQHGSQAHHCCAGGWYWLHSMSSCCMHSMYSVL